MCQATRAGWVPYRSASFRARSGAKARNVGLFGQKLWRAPNFRLLPWMVVRRTSGCFAAIHAGTAPVDVARQRWIPFDHNSSMDRSSHEKSYVVSSVWSFAHENTGSVATSIPASRNMRTSSFQTSSGHWSGL